MTSYIEWNDVIFKHFYNEKNGRKIIYLYVNSDLIETLGQENFGHTSEEAIDSFLQSFYNLTPLVSKIFLVAYEQGTSWFKQGMKGSPPFIGILALSVLAATKMGTDQEEGIGGGNYYHPLRELLDYLEDSGKPPFFEKTVDLWKMLYKWQEKNNFTFGETPAFPYGTPYTGYPRSQCLIRDSERLILSEFFEWANYKPNSILDKELIKNNLRRYLESKGGRLSNLFFMKNQSYQKHLVEQVAVELESWKRNKNSLIKENVPKPINKKIEMFLVLKFEGRLTKRIGELYFLSQLEDLMCEKVKFKDIEIASPFIRKSLNEFDEITFDYLIKINEINLSIRYVGNEILFFTHGDKIGIYGWVSTRILVPNKDYLILYKNYHHKVITEWLFLNNCIIRKIVVKGLPQGYSILMITAGQSIDYIEELETSNKYFTIDTRIQITLEGGLKISANEWMYDFPPRIKLTAPPRTEVKVNGLPIFSTLTYELDVNTSNLFLKPGTYDINVHGKNRNVTIIEDKEIDYGSEINKNDNLDQINEFTSFGVIYVNSKKLIDLWADPKKSDILQLVESEEKIIDIRVPKKLRNAQPYSRKFSELIITLGLNYTPRWRIIDTFVEYLTYLNNGNHSSFLKGIKECFGEKDVNLTAYIIKKNLMRLGIIEVENQKDTNHFYWKIVPTSGAYIPCSHEQHVLCITGARTRNWLRTIQEQNIRGINIYYGNPKSELEPISIYISTKNDVLLKVFLQNVSIYLNQEMTEYFSYELARCIPTSKEFLNAISPIAKKLYSSEFESWDFQNHRWSLNHVSNLIKIRNNYFTKCFIRDNDNLLEVDHELGKVILAAEDNLKFFNYRSFVFSVKKQYHLPDLFERVLSLCSGMCPLETNSHRVYQNVPLEIAIMVIYKLGFKNVEL